MSEKEVTLDELMDTKRTCKVFNKREREYLNFEMDYTKSEEIISELEDNDVDVSKYQTDESKVKEEQAEKDWVIFQDEHLRTCNDNHCVILHKYQEQNKRK